MSPSPNSPVPTLTTQPSIYSPQPVYHPNVRSPSLHSRAPSEFKSASKASSLLGPPLTRNPSSVASNSTAGCLPTPTDNVMHVPPPLSRDETTVTSYYRNQAFPEQIGHTGHNGLARKNRVAPGPRARPISMQTDSRTGGLARLEAVFNTVVDMLPPEERGSMPQDSAPMPPRMERQRPAQDLILRYEDLDSAAQAPPVTSSGSRRSSGQRTQSVSGVPSMQRRDLSLPPIPLASASAARGLGEANANPPHAPHSHCLPESSSYFSFARKGGKLRNSFTSLVQLLGDKSKPKDSTKNRNSVSPSVSPTRTLNTFPKGFRLRLSKRASAGSSPSGSPERTRGCEKSPKILPDMNGLLKTEPIISTLLLYQSPARQTHPSILDQKTPLWMPYAVSLYPNTIILQVPNPGLSSSSKFQIPLSELYDAHSIATKDLPPGSIPLLGSVSLPSGFGDAMYVFEAQCYGGRIERFAAPTMALRTTWVRHLLDVLADKGPESRNEGGASDTVEPSTALESASSLAQLSTESPPNPTSLAGDTMATYGPIQSTTHSKLVTEERLPPPLMRLSTPTRPLGRIPDSRSSSVCGARQVASVLPNPWDTPTTPPRQLTSAIAQRASSFMSPGSDRSGMTASPSICRLDERNLVRDRLATFERHKSLGLSGREPIRSRGKEGSINWEALSEIRAGRSISRTTSGLRSPDIESPFGAPDTVNRTLSPTSTSSNNGTLFKPMWPFPEPTMPGGARGSSKIKSKSGESSPEPSTLHVGLGAQLSGSRFKTECRRGKLAASTSLSYPSTNQPPKPVSGLIQVLGNLPPSKSVGANSLSLQSNSQPAEALAQNPSLQLVLDRVNSLAFALRESDVAHSTKTSGLGQLIASTQDHIIQAADDSAKVATAEHVTLTGHIADLQGMIESLVARPLPDAKEQTNLLSIKDTVERIDQIISKSEYSSGDRAREDREKMKAIITGQTDGLKHIIQDLALKLDWASTQNDVLAKLDALAEAIAGVPPTRDLDLMMGFVQQVKAHISPLPAPNLEPPIMDVSAFTEKLDRIANSVENLAISSELATVQKALEDIRQLSQMRQASDLSFISSAQSTDMSDMLMKLDGITAMCQSIMETRAEAQGADPGGSQEAQQTLLVALKEDAEQRAVQVQQTAELVRYSNELNAWLEKFVTNASTQMDSVGSGVGALRRDLGLDNFPSADEQEGNGAPSQGVVQELRAMFEEQIKSAADIAASLNALLVAFNEEQARNLQARENLATDSVLKMIEIQRQEQERLLKQLASGSYMHASTERASSQLSPDLSSDIRGERIRFVEAMSQATSMNVQLHVEEFKKQLTHEVLALTDEVGRLREERKTIQHQIAQLFLVKSEHELECFPPDVPQPPLRPSPSTRPNHRQYA